MNNCFQRCLNIFIITIYFPSLIDSFEWTGAIIITGAIVLLCVLFGALFRPLDAGGSGSSGAAAVAAAPIDAANEDLAKQLAEEHGQDKVDQSLLLLGGAAPELDHDEGSDSLGILPQAEMNGNHKFGGKPVIWNCSSF